MSDLKLVTARVFGAEREVAVVPRPLATDLLTCVAAFAKNKEPRLSAARLAALDQSLAAAGGSGSGSGSGSLDAALESASRSGSNGLGGDGVKSDSVESDGVDSDGHDGGGCGSGGGDEVRRIGSDHGEGAGGSSCTNGTTTSTSRTSSSTDITRFSSGGDSTPGSINSSTSTSTNTRGGGGGGGGGTITGRSSSTSTSPRTSGGGLGGVRSLAGLRDLVGGWRTGGAKQLFDADRHYDPATVRHTTVGTYMNMRSKSACREPKPGTQANLCSRQYGRFFIHAFLLTFSHLVICATGGVLPREVRRMLGT